MIKSIVAHTEEIDDIKAAVEEIKSQLGGLDGFLRKNTLGIVSCHYEFVDSGVLDGICKALPFEIVGTVSSGQATEAQNGELLLTLMVLTSDTVDFVTTVTRSLTQEPGKAIEESYKTASAGREKPALILAFAPFMLENTGDEYVRVISEVSGGAPCFGTFAIDGSTDFVKCFTLAGGEHYLDKLVMVLVYGDVKPKFYIANVSTGRIFEKSAVVTKSCGNTIMEVNERPITEYFEDLGLTKASEEQYAFSSLPFMLDYNDGAPRVSKFFIRLTPEKYAICAGDVPEGCALYIASADKDDVLVTTGNVVDSILKDAGDAQALLVYSCIGRSMTLGGDQFKEAQLIRHKISSKLPFMLGFSGGEMCPTQVLEEKAVNRFHNNAFIACLL
ncbi:MAG: FIST C-terminal domain-containing protein [Spirochaetes bacterium]|nr:FIST C-terminal domain-containing protein [Spirochaetota bacterium]